MRSEVFVAFLCLAWHAYACPEGQVQVTVAWDQGYYATEIRWEIQQFGVVVISGQQGGETKTACLQGGQQSQSRGGIPMATVGTAIDCASLGQTARSSWLLGVGPPEAI